MHVVTPVRVPLMEDLRPLDGSRTYVGIIPIRAGGRIALSYSPAVFASQGLFGIGRVMDGVDELLECRHVGVRQSFRGRVGVGVSQEIDEGAVELLEGLP